MKVSAIVNAAGASFTLLGPKDTQIKSVKPVISVCAVRTGAGKSQTSRKIVQMLMKRGLKVVAIRHPMPYGTLADKKSSVLQQLRILPATTALSRKWKNMSPISLAAT
jgi:predicted GTPase